MDGIDEIVREFLIESYENLDQLDQDLIALESNPGSRELLSSIFRTIHTIKGTSGFLAFHKLEKVTHVGESLLVELRDGRRQMDPPTTDVLLRMVDTVRSILGQIEVDGSENGVEIDDVAAAIQAALDGESAEAPAAEAAQEPEAEVAEAPADEQAPAEVVAEVSDEAPVEEPAEAELVAAAPARKVAPRARREAAPAEPAPVSAAPAAAAPAPAAPAVSAAPAPAANAPLARGDEATQAVRGSTAETSIRVDVDLLDELMRQVGELVLVRNQIAQITGPDADPELTRSSQRLSLIATELQEGVMKTRMQPIDHVWNKMPRVVRDLASTCRKTVDLQMVGGETEVDRSLLESVKDPLTHLVRNAVDHGIEDPEARVAAGKPEAGILMLRAYHAGGQVIVEVKDDGKGIDPEAVAAKAIERGLKTVEQLDAMSINEIQSLVFLPGFSTAQNVTNVSGRGVGMDVVRSNIESIGGQVEVESEVGRGTTWRLRIPLTLAIMPALTVASGDEIYAIPQVNLDELVALDTARTAEAIEHVGSAEVYRLRGDLLPLVRLSDVLRTPSRPDGSMVIAVLRADNQRFGLVVDRVMNNEEIVVKPLASQLKGTRAYAGATLMGDGRVALILDIQAIARRALAGDVAEIAGTRAAVQTIDESGEDLLIVAIDETRRAAVPLSAVTRLEQVPADRFEMLGRNEVLQYRGAILPVVRLESILGGAPVADGPLDVVVFQRGERSVALVVGGILEIVNDRGAERRAADTYGLVSLVVLSGKVTELVDLPLVLRTADPEYFDDVEAADQEIDARMAVAR